MENRVKKQHLRIALFVVTDLALATASFANAHSLPADGTIFVVDPLATVGPAIVAIDPNTGAQSVLCSGGLLSFPADIRQAPDGDTLYIADTFAGPDGTGAIIAVDPSTCDQTLITSDPAILGPGGLQFEDADRLIVVGSNFFFSPPQNSPAYAWVAEIDLRTGKQEVITSGGGLVSPVDVQLGPYHTVYVGDCCDEGGAGAILQVDLSTAHQTVIADNALDSDITSLGALAQPDSEGNLLFTNASFVLRIDPRIPGQQTLVAVGGLLVAGLGGVTANSTDDIFLSMDSSPAQILKLNPRTGAVSFVSEGDFLGLPLDSIVFYRHHN
jgi:hypothetical protein